VRINDRGPYGGGRVIDLSLAAFKALSSTDKGMIRVQLHVL
jgi:rare lipoprotein A